MNWNIVNFLPKAASCQEFFKVLFLLLRFFCVNLVIFMFIVCYLDTNNNVLHLVKFKNQSSLKLPLCFSWTCQANVNRSFV